MGSALSVPIGNGDDASLWTTTIPDNDFELTVRASKELEYLLESQFNCRGKGLHEKISGARSRLPTALTKTMREIAAIRNDLIHSRACQRLANRSRFIRACQSSSYQLRKLGRDQKHVGTIADGLRSPTIFALSFIIVFAITLAIGFRQVH